MDDIIRIRSNYDGRVLGQYYISSPIFCYDFCYIETVDRSFIIYQTVVNQYDFNRT